LKESDDVDDPEFTLFDIVRAYLSNFEHVISVNKDLNATVTSFQALERIIDGILKLLVQMRETRQQKKSARRKKRKSVANTDTAEVDGKAFTLVWEDHTVTKLVGDRSDCVWIVEQLWNIGNKLMSVSFVASGVGDLRGVAANVFAASHDFCLMSDEEVGQSLSKGFLDFDIKFDPTKSVLPSFGQTTDRLSCDISSEVRLTFHQGRCLDLLRNCYFTSFIRMFVTVLRSMLASLCCNGSGLCIRLHDEKQERVYFAGKRCPNPFGPKLASPSSGSRRDATELRG
jgi:hypothetical protein